MNNEEKDGIGMVPVAGEAIFLLDLDSNKTITFQEQFSLQPVSGALLCLLLDSNLACLQQ